jgi:hypothetical protein
MLENEVFDKLEKLFPNQINDIERKALKQAYKDIEHNWETNCPPKRTEIKYLLICEAPPANGKYFYSGIKTNLLTTVWKTFFDDSPKDINKAYHCFAKIGFLLVDTLPYAMNYNGHRNNPEYYELIVSCLDWWIKKLNNNFTFSDDLKIAFGFNNNALNVIIALNSKICLNQNKNKKFHTICPNCISATSAGQPSRNKLKSIFNSPQMTCP